MGYIVKAQILVDEDNPNNVYDGLNEMFQDIQLGGPNGESRGWIVDWKYDHIEPAPKPIDDAIKKGEYEEGMAFKTQNDSPGLQSFKPFQLVIESTIDSNYPGDYPEFAVIRVTPELLNRLVNIQDTCLKHNLESVTINSSPDFWDQEDSFRVRRGSLRIWDDEFWFEAWSSNLDCNVETVPIRIPDLSSVVETLKAGNNKFEQINNGEFKRINENIILYASSKEAMERLVDLYKNGALSCIAMTYRKHSTRKI